MLNVSGPYLCYHIKIPLSFFLKWGIHTGQVHLKQSRRLRDKWQQHDGTVLNCLQNWKNKRMIVFFYAWMFKMIENPFRKLIWKFGKVASIQDIACHEIGRRHIKCRIINRSVFRAPDDFPEAPGSAAHFMR